MTSNSSDDKMNYSVFKSSVNLFKKVDDRTCWTKFKSVFNKTSEESEEIIEDYEATYQRRKTIAFQIGADSIPTPITITDDDDSYDKHYEIKNHVNGILKLRVRFF